MTDRPKIVRIRARNVPRVHGHKRLDDDASLSFQESDGVACWCAGAPSCWNTKKCLRTTCACLAVASKQESCRDSMSSSLWHQIWLLSNLIVINQVLGKILEHLRLTRQCSDVGQVRWKMYYIAYNFSHFAIYLQKPIKIRGNLTKFWQKQKCTVFLWHGVVRSLGLT